MKTTVRYPYDAGNLLRKKKSIKRCLLQKGDFISKKIAIVGGSTTAEIKDMMEIFLLDSGIRPVFYESDYNRYYEDLVFDNQVLETFAPDVIYIHTSSVNIARFPSLYDDQEKIDLLLSTEMEKYQTIWDQVAERYGCPIIQNNFELPHYRLLGNLDSYDIHGRTRFIAELNSRFAEHARKRKNLYINDINYLSSWYGLEQWYDKLFWYSYKYAMSCEAIPLIAGSIASIIKAIFGKTQKCLVLDLDNTLWGGIIGDDGLNGIQIGKETPVAEAYTEFQQYIKALKERGIILAVCSKNDEANAREGFTHPDSILKNDDFTAFQANWDPKSINIRKIAAEINIGIDSLVFVDDNPVEREIITSQVPEVLVPEIGSDVTKYINVIDKAGFFETISLSADDLKRNLFYASNSERDKLQKSYADYDEFLKTLEMVAEICSFVPVYLDRITQLINKTNQFNVTTRRYTGNEIESMLGNRDYITLYGRLYDKFGDNGLISIIIGAIKGDELHIDLWLMSCRVLKRGMEYAMFDELVAAAKSRNISTIYGYYFPTAKNGMVSDLFEQMGFINIEHKLTGGTVWRFDILGSYTNKNTIIKVTK